MPRLSAQPSSFVDASSGSKVSACHILSCQERETLADDLLGRPAEERLGGVGHEREVALGNRPPEDIRRSVLHETAEAGLLAREPGEQVRVGQRDGRLVGQA